MSKTKEFDWNVWRKLLRELLSELPPHVKSIELLRDPSAGENGGWHFRKDEEWLDDEKEEDVPCPICMLQPRDCVCDPSVTKMRNLGIK